VQDQVTSLSTWLFEEAVLNDVTEILLLEQESNEMKLFPLWKWTTNFPYKSNGTHFLSKRNATLTTTKGNPAFTKQISNEVEGNAAVNEQQKDCYICGLVIPFNTSREHVGRHIVAKLENEEDDTIEQVRCSPALWLSTIVLQYSLDRRGSMRTLRPSWL